MIKSIKVLSAAAGLIIASAGALNLPAVATECYEKAPLHPIRRTFIDRSVEEPGVYAIGRRPALYGYAVRRVRYPSDPVWHEEAPVYRSVTRRIRVSGGWSWQRREVHGKEILCRVHSPEVYETQDVQVLVRAGRRWVERGPSVTGYVRDRVLLRPYGTANRFDRPYVRYSRETSAVQPEGYRWARRSLKPDC